MCVACQMQLLEDHRGKKGPFCPKCHRYRLGRSAIVGGGAETDLPEQTCYHCFAEESGEQCPVCAPDIPEVFFDPDMVDELKTVELARAKRIRAN
jgi:hypothetical protein